MRNATRRVTFERIERFIFRLIFAVLILIEGYKFIRFVAGADQPKPEPSRKMEQPAVPTKPAESPPLVLL